MQALGIGVALEVGTARQVEVVEACPLVIRRSFQAFALALADAVVLGAYVVSTAISFA